MNDRARAAMSKACPPRPGGEAPSKVRKPLERRTELAAKSPARLQRDAETGRSRSSSTFARTTPKRTPKEGPMDPEAWKIHAGERAGWRCEVTGEPLTWDWDAHHVIPKRKLKDAGLYRLVWHPGNSMALQNRIHMAFTYPGADPTPVIFAHHLKPHHLDFARSLDALGDTEEWSAYLERTYPQESR